MKSTANLLRNMSTIIRERIRPFVDWTIRKRIPTKSLTGLAILAFAGLYFGFGVEHASFSPSGTQVAYRLKFMSFMSVLDVKRWTTKFGKSEASAYWHFVMTAKPWHVCFVGPGEMGITIEDVDRGVPLEAKKTASGKKSFVVPDHLGSFMALDGNNGHVLAAIIGERSLQIVKIDGDEVEIVSGWSHGVHVRFSYPRLLSRDATLLLAQVSPYLRLKADEPTHAILNLGKGNAVLWQGRIPGVHLAGDTGMFGKSGQCMFVDDTFIAGLRTSNPASCRFSLLENRGTLDSCAVVFEDVPSVALILRGGAIGIVDFEAAVSGKVYAYRQTVLRNHSFVAIEANGEVGGCIGLTTEGDVVKFSIADGEIVKLGEIFEKKVWRACLILFGALTTLGIAVEWKKRRMNVNSESVALSPEDRCDSDPNH